MRVSTSSISISRGVRAPQSACPPSDAPGTNRPSMLCSSASPSPVPAAITAALPPDCATPCCSTASSSGLEHRHRVRHRFEVVEDVHAPQRRAAVIAAASTSHGTLVSRATWSVTAPATPNVAAAMPRALDAARLQELADHRHQAVVVERDELADLDRPRPLGRARRTVRAASWCRRCRPRAAWGPIIANRLDFNVLLSHLCGQ